jgi:proline dehydrogenase
MPCRLVRGAYMVSERQRAAELGYDDPIHATLEETHEAYHAAADLLLTRMAQQHHTSSSSSSSSSSLSSTSSTSAFFFEEGGASPSATTHSPPPLQSAHHHSAAAAAVEFMVASHNEDSVAHVLKELSRLGLPSGSVHFAQLLGMSDRVTYALGAGGHRAYKYVPYGPIHEVIPYLLRRAQENSGLLGSSNAAARRELESLQAELKRRALAAATGPFALAQR